MASTDVVTLEDGTFDNEVLKSDIPVLVDFWAIWCGPCKAIAPVVEQIAVDYKGKVKVGKMDIDKHQAVAAEVQHPLDPDPARLQGRQGGRHGDRRRQDELDESVKKVVEAGPARLRAAWPP